MSPDVNDPGFRAISFEDLRIAYKQQARTLIDGGVDVLLVETVFEALENGHCTDFCIGVAGYPEKHMEAPSLERDIQNLKAKQEAGAEYVVTQMFFDNERFFEFERKCRENGITVPIIPGLKPISIKKHLSLIPHRFHVDLPDELIREVEKCESSKEVQEVGVEWCIHQSRELIAAGVPVLHYYSMGKSTNIKRIAAEVF